MSGSDEDTVNALADTAGELRYVARPAFKARLRIDLQKRAADIADGREDPTLASRTWGTATGAAGEMRRSNRVDDILPTLFGTGYGSYPVHRGNFVASFVLHAAAMALVVTSGVWIVQHRQEMKTQVVEVLTGPSPYVLPASPKEAGGGGGGGDRDKIEAPKGSLPRLSREQLAPPAVVLRNPAPRLEVEATVIVPPSLTLPNSASQLGDPMTAMLSAPSNGTGSGGGIGDGSGGGVGSGIGAGVGPGRGGGYGGGVFRVGGGVTAPRTLYDPDPEYSEEARRAKYQGTVMLWVIIGPDGRAHDMKVARSLGMGLDERALEAVRKWRFEPAKKDGRPVAVQVNIEVNFRLY